MNSDDDTMFIAIEGIRADRLGEGNDDPSTLSAGVYDAVLEDTALGPEEVGIYVSSNDRIATVYVGIKGFRQEALTDTEGEHLADFVFSFLQEDTDLAPTSVAIVTDYRADMIGEPERYVGRTG